MKNLKKIALVLGFITSGIAMAKPAIQTPIQINDPVQWGGDGISVLVTKTPEMHASLRFDCATGTIDSVILDKKGGFLASGSYTQHTGARPPHDPIPQPAHYVGFAQNGTMSLMVVIDSDPGHSATYLLKKGSFGQLEFCP